MRKKLSKEEELIAKIEKQFERKTFEKINFKEEKEGCIFWYDPNMIPDNLFPPYLFTTSIFLLVASLYLISITLSIIR